MYPTLDQIVLDTIDLYIEQKTLPKLDLTWFNTPLVVWSGNGYYTGRILFRHLGAFFATESEVESKLKNISSITDVVVVSASGEKHAPIILNTAKDAGKQTLLISSSEKSSGREIAESSIIMPKIREPYTYNTSTYFGYMLAGTPDLDLVKLRDFIMGELTDALSSRAKCNGVERSGAKKDLSAPSSQAPITIEMTGDIDKILDFTSFSSFFIVIPDAFVLLREMFEVKFIELFGRKVARDIFTYEQMRHATTVVQDDGELFICFGNTTGIRYGKNQIDLPVFDPTNYAAMMLVGYYVVGKIQTALPPYFMESIEDYCARSKIQSGFDIKPWVEV